jgi:UDP-N-acetylglucosamine 2-epimerase (non-hydrolysing)
MLGDRPMVLVTGHRRESIGEGLARICEAILVLAKRFVGAAFVFPTHRNPQVHEPIHAALDQCPKNVYLRPPVSYPEFVWLMDRSTLILTDSGGVQEEAPSLHKPVLVTRDTTERPEAVEAGMAQLVGTSVETIVSAVSRVLINPDHHRLRAGETNPYGDGRAAKRIVDLIEKRIVDLIEKRIVGTQHVVGQQAVESVRQNPVLA